MHFTQGGNLSVLMKFISQQRKHKVCKECYIEDIYEQATKLGNAYNKYMSPCQCVHTLCSMIIKSEELTKIFLIITVP